MGNLGRKRVTTTVGPEDARAAFDREATRQMGALRAFALKLTHSHADADDLVSDTMVRALERWGQYQLGTNIRGWLFTILYHVFVSQRRRTAGRWLQPLEREDGRLVHEPAGELDPESRFYDSFIDESVLRAIDSLPPEYRAAVMLSDVHELPYAEVARTLGVPEGTVKSRLFRGRRILQRLLAGYAEEMGYVRRNDLAIARARHDDELPLSA